MPANSNSNEDRIQTLEKQLRQHLGVQWGKPTSNIPHPSQLGIVNSVFGRIGTVVAAANDYTWAQINKATSSIADITTRTHALLSSLTADDHTQYALLAGRSGGQTLDGDTASGGDLTLHSTAHATKGHVNIGSIALSDATPADQVIVLGISTTLAGILLNDIQNLSNNSAARNQFRVRNDSGQGTSLIVYSSANTGSAIIPVFSLAGWAGQQSTASANGFLLGGLGGPTAIAQGGIPRDWFATAVTLTDNTATAIATITVPNDSYISGQVQIAVMGTNATDTVITSDWCWFAIVAKSGTATPSFNRHGGTAETAVTGGGAGAGTLATSTSVSGNAVTLKIAVDITGITPSTMKAFLRWSFNTDKNDWTWAPV